jgi:hypothetical protein
MLLSKAFRTFGNRRATPLTSTSYTDRRATDDLPSWHSQLGRKGQVRCSRVAGHRTAWRKDPRPWTGNSHEGNPVAMSSAGRFHMSNNAFLGGVSRVQCGIT